MATPPAVSAPRMSRYLNDTERFQIIQRIDRGEKQAALAREFGVTRAAICHMYKNRHEIIARFSSLLASAQSLYVAARLCG
ncbi:TPA: hypothetical protein N0F65_005712 [Lagenidium giganteum]|uniref:HTH psq-type domain-containing protein n=1 Tax=Lagenidium giganteum TaxID=4803 RepID=A0AAV2ZF08_9STRA|nr:TPA: hypothetical protein N0F65_005712 [Lagenidium giganteum]